MTVQDMDGSRLMTLFSACIAIDMVVGVISSMDMSDTSPNPTPYSVFRTPSQGCVHTCLLCISVPNDETPRQRRKPNVERMGKLLTNMRRSCHFPWYVGSKQKQANSGNGSADPFFTSLTLSLLPWSLTAGVRQRLRVSRVDQVTRLIRFSS